MNNSAVHDLVAGRVRSVASSFCSRQHCSIRPRASRAAEPAPATTSPAEIPIISLETLLETPIILRRQVGTTDHRWRLPQSLSSRRRRSSATGTARWPTCWPACAASVTYDRNYSFLGARGVNRGDYNNRVLVLVDGHRINNNLSDGGFIGTEFILDADLIKQVEVIRGPVATLYGNNAFFGIINVRTRRGGDVQGLGAEVAGEVGEFDTYKGRATWGHNSARPGLLFSGSIYVRRQTGSSSSKTSTRRHEQRHRRARGRRF